MNNHLHISAMHLLICALGTILILFTMNLAAMKYKDDSAFWASWANLAGVE